MEDGRNGAGRDVAPWPWELGRDAHASGVLWRMKTLLSSLFEGEKLQVGFLVPNRN